MLEEPQNRHRPMATPDAGARVGRILSFHTGAAVPRPLDGHIAALMSSFAQLKPQAQKRFLEQLNEYLYASAAQRRQLRRQWPNFVIEPCTCHEDEPVAP